MADCWMRQDSLHRQGPKLDFVSHTQHGALAEKEITCHFLLEPLH